MFNVILSETSLSDVTVQYWVVQDGTALVNSVDLNGTTTKTLTLTIPAGQLVGQITYTTKFDNSDEFDENFMLEISDPVNGELGGGGPVLTATGVILDNNGCNDRALFVSDPKLIEGDNGTKRAAFEIRRSEPFGSDITLNYTADDTACAGTSSTARSCMVTFLAGQTVASVAVKMLGDNAEEGNETFSLIVAPTAPIFNGVAGATVRTTIRTMISQSPIRP